MSDEKSLLKGGKLKGIAMTILAVIAAIFGLTKGPDAIKDLTPSNDEKQEIIETTQNQETNEAVENQTVTFNTETTNQQTEEQEQNQEEPTPRSVTDDTDAGDQILTYYGKKLIYTHHAKCRMDCRYISKKEVGEVLKNGKINKRKSNPNDPRCPTVALEKVTSDGQTVRIIVADCDEVAKLVTVIDLKNKYNCVCK